MERVEPVRARLRQLQTGTSADPDDARREPILSNRPTLALPMSKLCATGHGYLRRMQALMVMAEAILGLCIGFSLAAVVHAMSTMPPAPAAAMTGYERGPLL